MSTIITPKQRNETIRILRALKTRIKDTQSARHQQAYKKREALVESENARYKKELPKLIAQASIQSLRSFATDVAIIRQIPVTGAVQKHLGFNYVDIPHPSLYADDQTVIAEIDDKIFEMQTTGITDTALKAFIKKVSKYLET